MRIFSGPALATAVSLSGGIGFLGPGKSPSDLEPTLAATKAPPPTPLLAFPCLTVHALRAASRRHAPHRRRLPALRRRPRARDCRDCEDRPRAAWLFVPGEKGAADLATWSRGLRDASPRTQIWIQVGSVRDAVQAAELRDAPDVLVLQGNDAGGHGLARGAGVVSLLPEVRDELEARGLDIPLMAAGGIADGRGVAALWLWVRVGR